MATFAKLCFSSSTNGKGIKVVNTVIASADTIHTAPAGTASWDEIWVYAQNNHTASLNLTLCWGAAADPDDKIVMAIPSLSGLYLVAPGLLLQNGMILKAFASSANLISLFGWVNRIS